MENTYYAVEKYEIATGRIIANYGGGYTMEDVKAICRGYKPNEFFPDMWERKNGKFIFTVTSEK